MTRKDIGKVIGSKLLQVRQANKLTITQMAKALNCGRLSYIRNENGQNIPNYFTIYNLGSQLGISMNWFILDEGPLRIDEITAGEKIATVSPPLSPDFKELFEHMEKIPLLRFEILAQFHRFKEEHQALVEKAMRPKDRVMNDE
jgi:transcriptional regulator with XRE-family HTH domain